MYLIGCKGLKYVFINKLDTNSVFLLYMLKQVLRKNH